MMAKMNRNMNMIWFHISKILNQVSNNFLCLRSFYPKCIWRLSLKGEKILLFNIEDVPLLPDQISVYSNTATIREVEGLHGNSVLLFGSWAKLSRHFCKSDKRVFHKADLFCGNFLFDFMAWEGYNMTTWLRGEQELKLIAPDIRWF